MKRTLAVLVTAACMVSLGIVAAPAASAAPQACVFQGNLSLSNGLGTLLLFPARSASFTVTSAIATCLDGGVGSTVSASGTLVGNCGRISASGVMTTPGAGGTRPFSYESIASIGVFSGGYVGVSNEVVNVTVGDNCMNNPTRNVIWTVVVAAV